MWQLDFLSPEFAPPAPEVKSILTKRLELLFRTVLALPKASSSGFDCRMMSFTCCNTNKQWHKVGCNRKPLATLWRKVKFIIFSWLFVCPHYLNFRPSSRYFGNVTHDVLGSHCLPSTALPTSTITPWEKGNSTSQSNATLLRHDWTFSEHKNRERRSPDDDTLILSINHHVSVHVVCQSIDVRWVLILGLRGWTALKWSIIDGKFEVT